MGSGSFFGFPFQINNGKIRYIDKTLNLIDEHFFDQTKEKKTINGLYALFFVNFVQFLSIQGGPDANSFIVNPQGLNSK